MADGKLIDTIYGKQAKFDIYKKTGWGSPTFSVYKDGEHWNTFSDLQKAVAAINKAAR